MPGALLQVLTRAGGFSDNKQGSYPHEDTFTVTGRGGNGSGALRMRKGWDADRTWETGGKQASKVMKIQECQILGMPLTTRLALSHTHLLRIFSAQAFSERSLAS